ncbi:hypothetical protein GCM10010919_25380 [Alishewanella longhuensis]|uniref:Uncharacterized protein n=1 Tax=Alishewanella longhuensis TaxID=1091037 RepID=A0ABQ3KZP3_9ALTE|nr:hypothetical protein [Alishewanella longhuensis]GHG72795.1 hypothetical protein GCM10010919_25380 [Alishewanella longhuensis]
MKKVVVVAMLLWLSGCQLTPVAVPPTETAVSEPEFEQVTLPEEAEPEADLVLALDDQISSLQAWLDYKQQILVDPEPERARLRELTEFDMVAQLQLALLSLHPDMPYVTRFRVQTQLVEMVSSFPPRLAAIFGWELTFNQKLLEAESAVSAVTRLNAQQQDAIDRLQKTNRDLQKKIDALTQIEAELNQPPATDNSTGANNGQG